MGHPLINSILRMSLAVILGSGGHTSELLKIISNLNLYFNKADNKSENLKSHPHRLVIFGDGDTLSVLKYKSVCGEDDVIIKQIPRPRRVGQPFFTSIFSTIYSFLVTVGIFLHYYPKVIICNGPAITISVSLAAYFIQIMSLGLLQRSKIIYIESAARTKNLSLTGNLMLYLADHFLIQWPELAAKYKLKKNVVYSGLLV